MERGLARLGADPLADVDFANQPEASLFAGEADPVVAIRRYGELMPFVVMKRGVLGSAAMM
jgi:hypothetical protein